MNYKILITSISIVVFAIIVFSLSTGITMREVTVVDHPYEDGLKYEATEKRYSALGWKVIAPLSLKEAGQLNIGVFDRNGAPLDGASVEFAVNRFGSPVIKKYRAVQANHGRFEALVHFPSRGYWDVRVNVTRGNETLSYDRRINIDG